MVAMKTARNRFEKKAGRQEQPQIRQAALFEHVDSIERFEKDGRVWPVLHDVSFEILCGQSWCALGTSHFELRLLLELLANARPYAKGRCVLCERGMMRKKRTVLPHVLYIGGTNMLFDNMNVLEYMMFITSHTGEEAVTRQKRLLLALIDAGLSFVSLSPIAKLTAAERSVVTLFAATLTDSALVVWNVSRISYTPALCEAAARITRTLREQGKALVFSSNDYALVQAAASHLMLIRDGELCYAGEADAFCDRWDKLLFTLRAEEPETYVRLFAAVAPDCRCEVEGELIRVYDEKNTHANMQMFYTAITAASKRGICPTLIERNTPGIRNAVLRALEEGGTAR